MKTHTNHYISTKDFLVSGESFDLVEDKTLKILVTNPQPKASDLPKYYESDAYISHSDSSKGIVATLYKLVKNYSLKKKLDLVNSLAQKKGNLLDIGCGTGAFLKTVKNSSWECDGVEPNSSARKLAHEKNLSVFSSLEDLPGTKKYDVITLWHVLEHLPNLKESIYKIESLLKPNGILIIAVPNYKSFDANYYKEFWAAYDVPRHLWHFSMASMKILFSEKTQLIKTKPMIFDSFYVSLLSEKYKNKSSFSIRAFFIGLWSNMRAWQTKEYSSLIYCFKKNN
ncbi:class I SAM-dependent methyltransferase [Patiriisocius hiemis]|uniref:Class I SAM-dependent methyltransferase n=1 Tax=Patiriisocius hiemis TaxID=3075604 RepID=A0ABU2YD34_9FLAO|nr:class I SAM-dependent methyltransferase [Constantimarinum sp. W242]MDT0555584.1 class I SAM-dependent methyltransferase [Constantimarinum sp. W242]